MSDVDFLYFGLMTFCGAAMAWICVKLHRQK